MKTVSIHIESFEGPLDLLLQLVEKNKIDIYEVQISEIIDSYLKQIQQWEKADMTVESEFILMASRLIEIKSRKLLPTLAFTEEEDDEALLLQQLALYRLFKKAAEMFILRQNEAGRHLYKDPEYLPRVIKKELPPLDPERLCKAYRRFAQRKDNVDELTVHKRIFKNFYSVRDKARDIQAALDKTDKDKLMFSEIVASYRDYREVLAGFLALLELMKTDVIEVYQESIFTDMEVYKKINNANEIY